MILCSDVKGFMKYFCFLVGWSCKLLTKKKSFSDPKIGLKWPKHKWTVTMATCYIWNVNVVYLDPKSLPSTKYKKNIPFFLPWTRMSILCEKTLKKEFFTFWGKKSLVLRQYCHHRIQLPKFLTPDMERPMLALITAERKIFWDPWQVDILGSKNRVKMSILQVLKTYCIAWCKNSTRLIFKAIFFFSRKAKDDTL